MERGEEEEGGDKARGRGTGSRGMKGTRGLREEFLRVLAGAS